VTENGPVVVLMAHTDIVFPDTEEILVREENGRMYAPGIGDDTANLVTLLMAAKYVTQHHLHPRVGVLIVANACEEGLGNLKGSKQIMKDYAGRIVELISLDGNLRSIVNVAVGSCRMRVTIHAQGGHSFAKFGNTNAIVQMARLITLLYEKKPPIKAKTTYNVGVIEGGTTINSICAECSMLYEYRSEDRECLQEMDTFFWDTVEKCRQEGFDIDVEVLGIRPCNGDVDENKLRELTERMKNMITAYTGEDVVERPGSTDANSALAVGIPAVTIGAMMGNGAHARGEWVDLESIKIGQKIALASVLQYMN